jgi:hypothetical protein
MNEYITEDLTLSGSNHVTIMFKKLAELDVTVYTIQQVGTDHFLTWDCTEGELHWSAEATDSCKWQTLGKVSGPLIIMAYQKDLPFRDARMLSIDEENRLIVKTKEYAASWYLHPTGYPMKYNKHCLGHR